MLDIHLAYQEWDPIARISTALKETQSLYKWFFPVSWWLPFQFYLIRFVNFFTTNEIVLIYLSTLFYAGGFGIQYKILSRYVKSHTNNLYLLIFLLLTSLNSVIFLTSLTVLTEPLFYFLSSLMLYFYFLIPEGRKYFWLFLFITTCNNLLRFESWFYTVFLAFPLLFNKEYRYKILLAAIVPFAWFFVQSIEHGNFLNWVNIIVSDGERSSIKDTPYELLYNTTRSLWYLLLLYIPLQLSFKDLRKKQSINLVHYLAIFFVIFILFMLYSQRAQPSHRYLVSALFLVITSIGYFIATTNFNTVRKKLYWLSIFLYFSLSIYEIRTPLNFHYTLISPKIKEVQKKIHSLPLSSERRLFISRIAQIDDFLYLSTDLFGTDKIIEINDFGAYTFYTLPHEIWNTVEREKVLYAPELKYVLHVHSGFSETFDEGQLVVLNLPDIIHQNFELIWENDIAKLYGKIEK